MIIPPIFVSTLKFQTDVDFRFELHYNIKFENGEFVTIIESGQGLDLGSQMID